MMATTIKKKCSAEQVNLNVPSGSYLDAAPLLNLCCLIKHSVCNKQQPCCFFLLESFVIYYQAIHNVGLWTTINLPLSLEETFPGSAQLSAPSKIRIFLSLKINFAEMIILLAILTAFICFSYEHIISRSKLAKNNQLRTDCWN